MIQDFRKRVRLLDMHAHLSCLTEEYGQGLTEKEKYQLGYRELKLRSQFGITSFFSAGTPEEWDFMNRCLEGWEEHGERIKKMQAQNGIMSSEFLLSFGIHPWYCDRYCPEDYREYLQRCSAVGEIGMDSVWCQIPLDQQRKVFVKQLELAAELKKPVILHTKGQEQEIAALLRDFPEKICVHWYSGTMEDLELFLELGCYFTLGPDLAQACQKKAEPSASLYQKMVSRIPADHVFTETDGISAVAWAMGAENMALEKIPEVLEENQAFLAARKGLDAKKMQERMTAGLQDFLGNVPAFC